MSVHETYTMVNKMLGLQAQALVDAPMDSDQSTLNSNPITAAQLVLPVIIAGGDARPSMTIISGAPEHDNQSTCYNPFARGPLSALAIWDTSASKRVSSDLEEQINTRGQQAPASLVSNANASSSSGNIIHLSPK